MNLLSIALSVIIGGINIGEHATPKTHEEPNCITAERIVKSVGSWSVLSTELNFDDNIPYLHIKVHNPLHKDRPDFVDAEFGIAISPFVPGDVQRYNLVVAVFHNTNTNVIFKRIYLIHQVKIKNKAKKFPIQTQCFNRDVLPFVEMEPMIIHAPPSTPSK